MPPTPQQLSDLALSALRPAPDDPERVVLEPQGLARLEAALQEVLPGEPLVAAITQLTAVGGFIVGHLQSEDTARQLMELVERFATPEVRRRVDLKVEKTSERVDAVGKRFDDFQGSRGEKLPDTGERLDPLPLKGPIRG